MATTGSDIIVASYQVLAEAEQDETFERLHQLRLAKEAGTESEMARFLRSLQRVAHELGRTPTADEYREVQPALAAAGEEVESFSRVYRFFGSWPRAREAVDLSHLPRQTPRRIEARFRQRRLGKVWRYDEDDLRETLARSASHYGYPPSTNEFEWWRQRELELAQAAGREDAHLPSCGPYRKRWGGWEQALLHFGYSPEELERRLTARNNIISRDWNPDALLPPGLPMADLRPDRYERTWPLSSKAVAKLCDAYGSLPRRSRHVLTVRLGLSAEPLTLKRAAVPLALSFDRVRQLQLAAIEELTDAVGADDGHCERADMRERVQETLRHLAVRSRT
jgi:hypothetical protein